MTMPEHVQESACGERRGHCTKSFEGAIRRLENAQATHHLEWREDFQTFAAKTEEVLTELGQAHAVAGVKISTNTEAVRTLSARGWGLFVAVAIAVLSGILGLVFSMATERSEAKAAVPVTTNRGP